MHVIVSYRREDNESQEETGWGVLRWSGKEVVCLQVAGLARLDGGLHNQRCTSGSTRRAYNAIINGVDGDPETEGSPFEVLVKST